ncbi:hypothetical protein OS493_022072 [Desmophyllum pertusum]|uniref:Protein kinase domain-containing protein n=1 Tax=Desmophyllum pertusum TaxID=174260 RepID=A0A9W9YNQ0_9CNID|nr:hypothetical protein OS493_022072 [Desmophyllum pertusum]
MKSFLVGRGAFAKVYKCTEKASGKEFAAKIVRFTKDNQDDLKKVTTEAEIWRTILDALDYLHRKGRIVHRDIKADNILLKQDSNHPNHFAVKITDFGLARRLPQDSDVITCDVEDTPLYLAPETILADPIGPAVDIWACGVILFLLLVGYPPFWQNDDRKLMLMIVEGCYNMAASYWDQVSDDATDLVKRMLVAHPHKRVTAFKALNHPWITDLVENDEERIRHDFVSR